MLHHVEGDVLFELLHKKRQFRPGPHQAHLALEYIKELRELVQGALSQERAEFCFPHVPVRGPAGVLSGIDAHGAEFIHVKGFFVPADPLLSEDDRSGRGQLDAYGARQHDRRCHEDQQQGANDIHRPLAERIGPVVQRDIADVHHRDPIQVIKAGV